jgi:hypothetical protein
MSNESNIIIYPDKDKSLRNYRRCIESGCEKFARSGSNNCVRHGGGYRCDESNCKSNAINKTGKCKAHGGGARCIESDCKTAAYGVSDKCVAHGGGTRCVETQCQKGAAGKTNKCVEHGGGVRCIQLDCKKSARSGSDKCVEHGGGHRCVETDCKNGAASKSGKCITHGGGIRCPNCINWIDSRGGKFKYDGYCTTCFKRVFPDDPRSKIIYAHTKEIRVRNEINTHFEGFIHDKPLYTSHCDCTLRRRIDHYKLIGNTLLCIETDEFAHSSYDPKDEEIRYDDIYMVHGGKMIFIRFNPDGKGIDIEDKLDILMGEITKQIERIEHEKNTDLVEIIKMFY